MQRLQPATGATLSPFSLSPFVSPAVHSVISISSSYDRLKFISFNPSCFDSYADNENECPACHTENKRILDIVRAQV